MRARVLVGALLLALLVAGFAVGLVIAGNVIGDSSAIDCGPEGIPALNGTACIDREPVYLTNP